MPVPASGPRCRRRTQLSPGRGPSHQGQPLVQALGPTLVPRGRPAWCAPVPALSRSHGGREPCPGPVLAGPPPTEPTGEGEGPLGLSCLPGRCSRHSARHSAHTPRARAPAPTRSVLGVLAAQQGDSAEEVTSWRPVPSRARWHARRSFLSRVQGRHRQSHAAPLRADERTPGTVTAQGAGGSGPPHPAGPPAPRGPACHASSAPSAWPGHTSPPRHKPEAATLRVCARSQHVWLC